MKLQRRTLPVAAVLLAASALLVLVPATSADDPLLTFGPSDADTLDVLSGVYDQSGGPGTGYWWDHSDLTVAVSAAPNEEPQLVQAVRDAIATWSSVLESRLPIVSLTDVTDDARNPQTADIILRYIPKAGGFSWGGLANCGYQRCPNVLVRSDLVGIDLIRNGEPDFDATRVYLTAVHELGHALGLGHATPLLTSLDIMGYGWALPDPDLTPILSDCDLDGIAAAFEWAVNAEDPHPATVSSIAC